MSDIKNYPFRPCFDGTFINDGSNTALCFQSETVCKDGKIIRRSYAPATFEKLTAWEQRAAQWTKEYTPTLKDRIKKFLGLKLTDLPVYTPDVLEIRLKKTPKSINFGTVMSKFLKKLK